MQTISTLGIEINAGSSLQTLLAMRQRFEENAAAAARLDVALRAQEAAVAQSTRSLAGLSTVVDAAKRNLEGVGAGFRAAGAPTVAFRRQVDDVAGAMGGMAAPAVTFRRVVDDAGNAMKGVSPSTQSLIYSLNGLAAQSIHTSQSVGTLFSNLAPGLIGGTATVGFLAGAYVLGKAMDSMGASAKKAGEQAKEALARFQEFQKASLSPTAQAAADRAALVQKQQALNAQVNFTTTSLGVALYKGATNALGFNDDEAKELDTVTRALKNFDLATTHAAGETRKLAEDAQATATQQLAQLRTLEPQSATWERLTTQAAAYYRTQAAGAGVDATERLRLLGLAKELDDAEKSLANTRKHDATAAAEAERKALEALNREAREDVAALKYRTAALKEYRDAVAAAQAPLDRFVDSQLAATRLQQQRGSGDAFTDPAAFRRSVGQTAQDAAFGSTLFDLSAVRRQIAETARDFEYQGAFHDALYDGVRGAITTGVVRGLQDGVVGGREFWSTFAQLGAQTLGNALQKEIDALSAKLSTGKLGAATSAGLTAAFTGYAVGSAVSGGNSLRGALAGSASGAATGALAGTAILPGVGTAIGAAVGSVVGAIGGLVGAHNKAKKAAEDLAAAQEAAAEAARNAEGVRLGTIGTLTNDLNLRSLTATGQDDAAAALQRRIAQDTEYYQALDLGVPQALLDRLREVQALEEARVQTLAKQAAAEQRTLSRNDFSNSVATLGAQAVGDTRTEFVLGVTQNAAQTAKGFTDMARAGVISFEELTSVLGLLNVVTQKQIDAYDAQVKQQHDVSLADAQARTLTAQGRSAEAEAIRIRIQYENELTEARKQGADVLTATIAAQEAETKARAEALAKQRRQSQEDFAQRLVTLQAQASNDPMRIAQAQVAGTLIQNARDLADAKDLLDQGVIDRSQYDAFAQVLKDTLPDAATIAAKAVTDLAASLAQTRTSLFSQGAGFLGLTPEQNFNGTLAIGSANPAVAGIVGSATSAQGVFSAGQQWIQEHLSPTALTGLSQTDLAGLSQTFSALQPILQAAQAVLGQSQSSTTAGSGATAGAGAGASFLQGATSSQIDRYGHIAETQLAVLREIEANTRLFGGAMGGSLSLAPTGGTLKVEVTLHNGSPDSLTIDPTAADALGTAIARGLTPDSPLTVSMQRNITARATRSAYRRGNSGLSS